MKVCNKCLQSKPETDFYFNKYWGHYNSSCKSCSKVYIVNRRKRRSHWLDKWKKAKGCAKCEKIDKLDLHHVDASGKDFCPSNGRAGKISKLIEEVRKCVVLCRSCHMWAHGQLRSLKSVVG